MGKTFPQKICQETFLEIFRYFGKISDRKISRKFFRENVGNFFGRRPVRKPPKMSPGLFRKTEGLFVRNRFGNVCFLHKFRGEIRMVSLRIPAVSRKIPRGISPGIPGNSGGKIRGFFPVFSRFPSCNAGLTPVKWGHFRGKFRGKFWENRKIRKIRQNFFRKIFPKKISGKIFPKFPKIFENFCPTSEKSGYFAKPALRSRVHTLKF